MRLRLINLFAALLLTVATLSGCGQTPTTQTVDAGPIDRHVSHLILTRHARCRMECRHITEKEIRQILEEGTINYRKSQPPKYALEGYTKEGQHLRIIFAIPKKGSKDDDALVVVTCIELNVEWQCDCK